MRHLEEAVFHDDRAHADQLEQDVVRGSHAMISSVPERLSGIGAARRRLPSTRGQAAGRRRIVPPPRVGARHLRCPAIGSQPTHLHLDHSQKCPERNVAQLPKAQLFPRRNRSPNPGIKISP